MSPHFPSSTASRRLVSWLENISSRPLPHLRLGTSPLPLRHGALALAHGNTIHLAAHAPQMDSDAGRMLLVHELVHLLQQAQQPLDQGGRLFIDPVAEAQADALAYLAVRHPERATAAICQAFDRTIQPLPLAPDRGVMQPNVHVMVNGVDTKLTDADKAVAIMKRDIKDVTIRRHFTTLSTRITPVLRAWIKSSRVIWKRFVTRRDEHTVLYNSWDELARALLGEVRSESNLQLENGLARNTVESAYVRAKIIEYIKYVYGILQKPELTDGRNLLLPAKGSYSGDYKHWYPTLGGFKKIFTEPEKANFKQLAALLHDMSDGLGEAYDDCGTVPDEKCVASVLVPTDGQGYNIAKVDLNIKMPNGKTKLTFREGYLGSRHCTLKETSDIIMSARDMGMPLEFGPSFTTGRLLQCCDVLCGIEGKDPKPFLTCIAWTMFAFWNQYYEKKFSRGHRFHEVMDMALNYGVAYEPFSYPASCPSYANPDPIGSRIG